MCDENAQNPVINGSAELGDFTAGGGSTYDLSGVTYFTAPRGAYEVDVSYVYKNTYSSSTSAVTVAMNSADISTVDITGTGLTGGGTTGTASATLSLPPLDPAGSDPQNDDIKITANIDADTAKSLPGGGTFGDNSGFDCGIVKITILSPLKTEP